MSIRKWSLKLAQASVAAVFISGCAAAPVALLPASMPALIAGAGGGISYTFTNIAYRIITKPPEEIEEAVLKAMDRMSIKVEKVSRGKHDIKIRANTRKLKIDINLERMTPTLTRMKVNAKRGLIFKDKNTAFEIIYQTESFLFRAGETEQGSGEQPKPMQEGAGNGNGR